MINWLLKEIGYYIFGDRECSWADEKCKGQIRVAQTIYIDEHNKIERCACAEHRTQYALNYGERRSKFKLW